MNLRPWDSPIVLHASPPRSCQPARIVEWPAEGAAEAPVQKKHSAQMGHHYLESGTCSEAETFHR